MLLLLAACSCAVADSKEGILLYSCCTAGEKPERIQEKRERIGLEKNKKKHVGSPWSPWPCSAQRGGTQLLDKNFSSATLKAQEHAPRSSAGIQTRVVMRRRAPCLPCSRKRKNPPPIAREQHAKRKNAHFAYTRQKVWDRKKNSESISRLQHQPHEAVGQLG